MSPRRKQGERKGNISYKLEKRKRLQKSLSKNADSNIYVHVPDDRYRSTEKTESKGYMG